MTDRGDDMLEKPAGKRRVWFCAVVFLAVALAIVPLLGLSLWTLILTAIFLACPVAVAWSYFTGARPLPVPLGPEPETRGMTLNWIAPWYDGLCRIVGLGTEFRTHTIALARLASGMHVLDVGCGTGVLTRRAAEIVGRSGSVIGVDPAPDMIRLARQEAARLGNSARFELAAVEALPFEDNCFDAVLASLVVHHLPTDLKEVGLAEMYRVLKPGGRLMVVDLDRPGHWFWHVAFWPMRWHRGTREHLHGRTGELVRQAGFTAVTAAGAWMGLLTFWTASKPMPASGLLPEIDARHRQTD